MATIQEVYIALFGRPADPIGYDYYVEATNDGANLDAVGDLSSSPEYLDRFEGLSNIDIVNQIYQDLFGRPAEAAGLLFYVGLLNSGAASPQSIAIQILDGASGPDAEIVANKVAAAQLYTDSLDTAAEISAYQGDAAADAGRAFIKAVTADDATVPTQAQVDAAIATLVDTQGPGGATGGTFALTPGGDYADNAGSIKNDGLQDSDFAFGDKNDTVIANATTLTADDSLLDSSTEDFDTLQYTGAQVDALSLPQSVQNIERLDVRLANAAASQADLTNYTGVQSVLISGTIAAAASVEFVNFNDSGVTDFNITATGANAASEVLIDGAGNDEDITVKSAAVAVDLTLGEGANSVTTAAGNDDITVGNGNNSIVTGAGNDAVVVGDGDNTIDVGAGNDDVEVGDGENTVTLGDGTNSLIANGTANGNNTVTGGAGVDTITLGNGDNTINSGAGADQIQLGNGDNTVTSGDGVQTITVGDGDNTITTGAGADIITVGDGDNTITAGAGADDITLGADGNVTLVFAAGDSDAADGAFDLVDDFGVAAGDNQDYLDFGGPAGTAANFLGSAAGVADFAAALTAAETAFAGNVALRYFAIDDTADTWVFADIDADGTIDFAVELTGLAAAETLTFSSFV